MSSATIIGVSLMDAIMTRTDGLRAATAEYAGAMEAASGALCAQLAQQRQLEIVEATVRARITAEVTGGEARRTAPERDATIAARVATDPRLREARDDAFRLRQAVETTRTRAAVADQAQKALRAELAALAALAALA